MLKVPINLSGKVFSIDVYVVEQNVPFLMGGRFLRDVDAQINMKKPALLLIDRGEVEMKTLDRDTWQLIGKPRYTEDQSLRWFGCQRR